MTAESLNKMPINDLFDLMVKSVNELLDMHKSNELVTKVDAKRKEVEMIQIVIVTKRAEESPLK